VDSFAVVIPSNPDFEIIKKLKAAKLHKTINYLKWTRNKFKIRNGEIKIADILELNLKEHMYGCQKEEDKFIIWKHAVKWRRYTEINANEEAVLFENFTKKKKRRKIETIYNCVRRINIEKIMKEGKIYNLFVEGNLEFIIRKAVRKRNSNLNYLEKEENLNLKTIIPEKVCISVVGFFFHLR
jgi:hypothetical protein